LVAPAIGCLLISSVDHGTYLLALEILNNFGPHSLRRYCKETLAQFDMLGVTRGNESSKAVDCSEPCIAGRGRVVTFFLQMLQKRDDGLWGDVDNIQFYDTAPTATLEESEQKLDCVPV
jgi:hypothetical protein